ncbi:MAG: amino acid adenylation domain-containing protein [Actinomycetota bacterium]|nr:amino acid adenylation domain-containing protein [Actinomycetota bacterium]
MPDTTVSGRRRKDGRGHCRAVEDVLTESGPDGAVAVLERDCGLVLVDSGFDQEIRPPQGTRLDRLFEAQCDRLAELGRSGQLAVDSCYAALTYHELDCIANQLARYLLIRGVRAGDRVGLLLDQGADAYIAMLAVLKVQAAYVPLDAGFPAERIAYIVGDAEVRLLISVSSLADRLPDPEALDVGGRDVGGHDVGGRGPGGRGGGGHGVEVVLFDEAAEAIGACDHTRLNDLDHGGPVDDLAYLIYTSGSTGRPKGVAVCHPSICNFVLVAAEVYGIAEHHRVYQGLSVAFDFSVEEIWVPWMVGATLVPKPGGPSLLGAELHEFLSQSRVSALCCVPTLLATLDDELPELSFVLVSGEACPRDLMVRWHRPGRRFLNVYGPTEATVSATWTVLDPDRPLTIGVPLPTYSVVLLDPERPIARRPGQTGEIGIAGVGLARGYLNRDDLTEKAFIPDFLGIANNPSGRIYRTGDLGRVNDDGEIEFLGRIDTQVKIRGYRIELTEIESVLLQAPGVAQAVVDTHQPEPDVLELVGYYSPRADAVPLDREGIWAHLREQLPAYMVPTYLEQLAVIPMTTSDKADRKALPAPSGPRGSASSGKYLAPSTPLETMLADELAQVLRVERVSVDSDFFTALGADSLLMARFCGKLRTHPELTAPSMREIYQHPTVQTLAAALSQDKPTGAAPPETSEVTPPTPVQASTFSYVMTGVAQLVTFLVATCLGAAMLDLGYQWISETPGLSSPKTGNVALAVALCERSVTAAMVLFVITCTVPILLKWALVGRWQRVDIPIWSPAYFRFWLVKTAIRSSPLRLFIGSPLYVLYLRALGAKIGKDVLILATNVPVCTDLLAVGDGTVIPKNVHFDCYRAHSGVIQTGRVTIGRDVFIGEMSVLDIETSLGDGAQLGYTSSLHAGQAVPAGQTWHGTPARPADVDYRSVAPARCGTLRKLAYSAAQLLLRLGVYPTLAVGGLELLATKVKLFADPLDANAPLPAASQLFHDALGVSAAAYFGGLVATLAFVCTVPRLLGRLFTPDRVYPLYGFHYACQRTIARVTNNGTLTGLFGDSSYIVGYLRGLGYDLSKVEQTGSNFGMAIQHDTPYLSSVGSGTLVSDGLSMVNASYSSTSFRVSAASIGARNFVGNGIAYPAGGRTGENCLLATKVMIPMHGEVREGVGLLGSPPFEIPRSVRRDGAFDHLKSGDELRQRLTAKNRHNLATIAITLAVRWIFTYGAIVIGLAAIDGVARYGAVAFAAGSVGVALFGVVYFICVERLVTAFRSLQPRVCSIYEPYFWWHERYWKVPAMGYVGTFSGTPFKGMIWRLLGVRIGRRVFDDGCWMTERSLVTIGDHCTLGATSTIQSHSLEDGAFKSDHISIGSGSTLATHAFVHYGVTMGESSVLAPDSFLMKGEVIAPGDSWLGNPARPANQPAEQHDPEGNTYLGELIRRVSALEGKIDELAWTAARAGRRGRVATLVAASLALVLVGGVFVGTANPALSVASAAAWDSLVGGVPSAPLASAAQPAQIDPPPAPELDGPPGPELDGPPAPEIDPSPSPEIDAAPSAAVPGTVSQAPAATARRPSPAPVIRAVPATRAPSPTASTPSATARRDSSSPVVHATSASSTSDKKRSSHKKPK